MGEYTNYTLRVDQAVIDDVARQLARWGYDVGDRPVVQTVGVTPNLRLAVGVALANARKFAEQRIENQS
jgi:hypothetical protein